MKQIQRHDFIAIVGFFANTALVDKKLQVKIKKLSVAELLEQGYYKEAVRYAFYEKQESFYDEVLEFFRKREPIEDFSFLARKFGIQEEIISKINKIKYV